MNNKIADLLKAIAYITYFGGALAVFIYLSSDPYDINFALIIAYLAGAFVSGSLFLGLAEIIDLLNKINLKETIITTEKSTNKSAPDFSDLPRL